MQVFDFACLICIFIVQATSWLCRCDMHIRTHVYTCTHKYFYAYVSIKGSIVSPETLHYKLMINLPSPLAEVILLTQYRLIQTMVRFYIVSNTFTCFFFFFSIYIALYKLAEILENTTFSEMIISKTNIS